MEREGGLLKWQWSLYPDAHRDRRNLALHAATAPIFLAGTCALALSPLAGVTAGVVGATVMLASMLAQGRGHKLETSAPAPFLGPGGVVKRFLTQHSLA